MPQYCPSVCPSVTFRYRYHICWNTSKIISPPNSDKIVMWRFLRNRRLLLCLHTIFRALIYWAHRVVILAIAWHLVVFVQPTYLFTVSPALTGTPSEQLWRLGFVVAVFLLSRCPFCRINSSKALNVRVDYSFS